MVSHSEVEGQGMADQDSSPSARTSRKLWSHDSPETTAMATFSDSISKKYNINLSTYNDLHRWSTDNIETFWGEVWEFTDIKASKPYDKVVGDGARMWPRPSWFEGAKLNFAENLLFPKADISPNSLAVIAATEITREEVSWEELRNRVAICQTAMRLRGVKIGDRVAGYTANHAQALVAMLAATSLGAIWTAVSPDTGVTAVLDRMIQIGPIILFVDLVAFYNGKNHPTLEKVIDIAEKLQSVESIIIFPRNSKGEDDVTDLGRIKPQQGQVQSWNEFIGEAAIRPKLEFAQLPPDHPVYILYSSGTTGAPKCIVHGAVGTLIQHKKEHVLHCGIQPGSRLFYFTTCTWMMWHWLVSGLASGATIVLYDGSPFRYPSSTNPGNSEPDDLAMPRLIEELGVTHFGTSAKYLSILEQKRVQPLETFRLASLQAIYSTGSPLPPSTFEYVYQAFPRTINLGSITGGTDIISLFGAPCPLMPVYVGEIQCLGLGMAVRAWDHTGRDVTDLGEEGELVSTKPFPCQPVCFWGEGGEAKYFASYFDKFSNGNVPVWCHGDFIRINPATGGLTMLGRSDGVLKPAGVRFGSAEIYNVLQKHFSDQVVDALCIGRRRDTDTDETVCLFVKMAEGKDFTDDLVKDIKDVVRRDLSARHVPSVVDRCYNIPVTTNGKKVEAAVKQILCGTSVKTSASVANEESLDWFKDWASKHAD